MSGCLDSGELGRQEGEEEEETLQSTLLQTFQSSDSNNTLLSETDQGRESEEGRRLFRDEARAEGTWTCQSFLSVSLTTTIDPSSTCIGMMFTKGRKVGGQGQNTTRGQ